LPLNDLVQRQGQHLLQLGVALFLFTSFEGFFIEALASPALGHSTHTLSALIGVMLLAFGLLWPRLALGTAAARVAFWCLIYLALAIDAAFLLAALWGAGNMTMPLAAGGAHGSSAQEIATAVLAYSSAPTGIITFAIILWGLRGPPRGA
jgi:(hydroxyamino)benzene mutase